MAKHAIKAKKAEINTKLATGLTPKNFKINPIAISDIVAPKVLIISNGRLPTLSISIKDMIAKTKLKIESPTASSIDKKSECKVAFFKITAGQNGSFEHNIW